MKKNSLLILVLIVSLISACQDNPKPITFSAVGDVPYSKEVELEFDKNISIHNANSNSSFLIHLGDIKPGKWPCEEGIYDNVSGLLKKIDIPVYIIPGDNEFNDCDNTSEAFSLWEKYFMHFHENWEMPWKTDYQPERKENFTWVEQDVLFVGLNLVGGSVHDSTEWNSRLKANADWIESLIQKNNKALNALVVFGHANMDKTEKFKVFVEKFRSIAAAFQKPILYLQGDGHYWIHDRPWKEQNIQRVQVDAGARILKVEIDTKLENPFIFTKWSD